MTRRVYAGRIASKGIASGTLWRDADPQLVTARPATTVIAAVAATIRQLTALQRAAGKLGSDILQFQIEMLEDDAFVADLLQSAAAKDARRAIETVMNGQIQHFLKSDAETFAARALDLTDLRDRLLANFAGGRPRERTAGIPEAAILVAEDLTPSRFLELDWSKVKAVAAQAGSAASHVALLARAQSVPMLVGVGKIDPLTTGRSALLDAVSGRLIVDPEPAEVSALASGVDGIVVTDDEALGGALLPGGEPVEVHLSVNALTALDQAPREWFDGIGLVRTELLLRGPEDMLDETYQAESYRRLFAWAGDRPVTIRLFDAGGDKPIPGFSLAGEANPFLGTRGARILARRQDVLETQYAAILAAAAGRSARILIPMLSLPREMVYFRETLQKVALERGLDASQASLGMMVETPSAALEVDKFGADFFSVGTNDLIQYTLAASRDGNALDFGDDVPAAVLELIARVVEHGEQNGADVSLCGDAATSPVQLKQILECGIRSIAVPGKFAPRVKHLIRHGA